MQVTEPRLARIDIAGVVRDGEAAIVAGVIAFRPNLGGAKPETARSALIDGAVVKIWAPALNKRAGVWEARIDG